MRVADEAKARVPKVAAPLIAVLVLPGCSGVQLALDPAGPQAGRIYRLGWLFGGVCLAVYLVVMLLLIGAILRRGQGRRLPPILDPPAAQERRLTWWVGIGVAV